MQNMILNLKNLHNPTDLSTSRGVLGGSSQDLQVVSNPDAIYKPFI